MEKYKSKVWARIMAFSFAVMISSGVYISGMFGVFDKFLPKNERFEDFMSGFQTGIFFVIILSSVYNIAKYLSSVNNAEKLKNLYICENDERKRAINDKAGQNLFMVIAYTMLVATLVAGYFSTIVFFTILCTLFVTEIIFTTMKIYYSKTM